MPIHQDFRYKVFYFFIWCAIGAIFPFISVYYRSIGLSGTQIGLVGMSNSLVGAISSILWGMFYDRTGRLRLLLTITCGGAVAACLALSQAQSFATILLCAGTMSFFGAALLPLLDSLTVRMLGDQSGRYGEIRLWGTVGFMVASATTGSLFASYGYQWMFWIYALGLGVFWLMTLPLKAPSITLARSPFAGLSEMVRQPAWLVFASSAFLLWLASMGGVGFLGVVIKETGGSDRLVGLAATVAAASEIPLLMRSSWLLNRYGADKLSAAAFLFYTLRMLLYAWMPAPSWAPWINLINGISYIPFLIGSVAYANQLAPSDLKATSMGLLTTVLSLAGMVGIALGGWLFDHVGPAGLYNLLAGVCLAAFVLFWLGKRLQR